MLKRLQGQTWTCSKCLLRQRQWKRSITGTAFAISPQQDVKLPPAHHSISGAKHDDRALRKIFDSQPFWKEFSQRTRGLDKRGGLLQNRFLTGPDGFEKFTASALHKCRKLVTKVLSASTVGDYKDLVRDMDRLSDLLCRVIDLVDFIRSVHPDQKIQSAASEAHALMYEYMNILNTSTGLNDQLEKAVSIPKVWESWNEEEKTVAKILLKDFAQSALQGTDAVRQKFVEVANDISQIGPDLVDNMAPEKLFLQFKSSKLKGMNPSFVKQYTQWGITSLPTVGMPATMALRTAEDPEVRREMYMANRTASKESIHRVEQLMKKRAELAKLSGYESFSHMALSDKMAKTPEAVMQFLEALAADNEAQVNQDLAELVTVKHSDVHVQNSATTINAWDRDYYTTRLRSRLYSSTRLPDILASYFSLGTVMQGLSRLFDRLYGVRLVPHETLPGETWNDDVRRLDVIDETEGHIAVIYCDLFQRPNKSPNPAHFTLRCSRRITPAEIAESAPSLAPTPSLADLSDTLNDGMASSLDPITGSLNQLPTIALVCDFPRPRPSATNATNTTPTLLTFNQLSTLFHEMGHALHSLLGRTALQNVAGTRCATDIAELPSILMEHFAADPSVLALYARHWETDAPLPYALVADARQLERRLAAASDTEAQVQLAVLDQRFHGREVSEAMSSNSSGRSWSSTSVYEAVMRDPRFAAVAEPRGTAWHGFFGHLFGYGAVYYSYLFDRAIAGKVFADVFARDAVDRGAGGRYRDAVLKWGGARDGWACVADVLGERYAWMEEGGPDAMKEVGRWGAGSR